MPTKAVIRNFKSLFDGEVTFESPLTVIVGPYRCGKSSVLKAIEFNSAKPHVCISDICAYRFPNLHPHFHGIKARTLAWPELSWKFLYTTRGRKRKIRA